MAQNLTVEILTNQGWKVLTSKNLTNANVFILSSSLLIACLLRMRHFISYTHLWLCCDKTFITGMHMHLHCN